MGKSLINQRPSMWLRRYQSEAQYVGKALSVRPSMWVRGYQSEAQYVGEALSVRGPVCG